MVAASVNHAPTNHTPNTQAPVLELKAVKVTLGRVAIISGVSLTLGEGEFVWLSGPNGAGKSTLLRAVVGLLPYDGDIEICGHAPRSLRARAAFAYLPDEAVLYEDLSLAEHVTFTTLVYRQKEREGAVIDWLERFRLRDRLSESPSTHSRGMRQKLVLSLALGLDLPLLLLDEPYNGLDVEAQEELSRGLKERVARGGTVLLSAHQAEVTRGLGARLL
nr:ABC transporter ATP-binding protein [Deinococcota bacterium]